MAGRVRAALGVAEGKATAVNHRDALAMKTDMTADLDIYRAANELIQQHGEDAPIHAAMRADAMLEAGDRDAYSFRHSYATQRLLTGISVYTLAENMGTSVAMIEKHYGHVRPELAADELTRK